MDYFVEFLDTHHERLLSIAGATQTDFSRGTPLQMEPARLQQLSEILRSFVQAQSGLTRTSEEVQPGGYYALSVFPEVQQQVTDDMTAFSALAQDYLVQARHPGSGQIVGLSQLRDLVPSAVKLADLSPPQAIAATIAATLVLDTLESITTMHTKLDGIQRSLDALHIRMDAQDSGKLSAALKDARRFQQEMSEPGITETDRRDARQNITANLSQVQAILDQDRKLIQDLVQSQAPDRTGRLPQLPVAVQSPIKRRTSEVKDETIPLFARLVYALGVKAQLLVTLNLTELRRGIPQREEELRTELEGVQTLHREFRRLWAKNLGTVQKYGVNVNAQFELADQLERLSREVERLRQRPQRKKTLVLQVGRSGQVVGVAALPSSTR